MDANAEVVGRLLKAGAIPDWQDEHGPVRYRVGRHADAVWDLFECFRCAVCIGWIELGVGGCGGEWAG